MSLEDDMALLATRALLAGMERDALRLLAFAAETRQLRAGDVLFRKGDVSDGGYVVASGAIAMIEDDDDDGRRDHRTRRADRRGRADHRDEADLRRPSLASRRRCCASPAPCFAVRWRSIRSWRSASPPTFATA